MEKNLKTCSCTNCTCEKPSANLAINKSRLKKYDKNSDTPIYYLKDGQEFEIELFNPKSNKVSVKIKINGSLISQSGVVLNPGQRVFLDRYIDIPKKFKFETYTVGTSDAIEKAIKDNGDIEFLFYDEIIILPTHNTINLSKINGGYWGGNNNWDGINNNYYCTTNFGTGNLTTNNPYLTTTNTSNISSLSNTNSNYVNTSLNIPSGPIKRYKAKKQETGRIEAGSESDQKFDRVYNSFNSFVTHEVKYKLLPVSKKNIEVQDLKKYCTNCGASLKKNHRFCAQCGTKG